MTFTQKQAIGRNRADALHQLSTALCAARMQASYLTLEDIAEAIRDELGEDARLLIDKLIEATTCPLGICDGSGRIYDAENGDRACPHTKDV